MVIKKKNDQNTTNRDLVIITELLMKKLNNQQHTLSRFYNQLVENALLRKSNPLLQEALITKGELSSFLAMVVSTVFSSDDESRRMRRLILEELEKTVTPASVIDYFNQDKKESLAHSLALSIITTMKLMIINDSGFDYETLTSVIKNYEVYYYCEEDDSFTREFYSDNYYTNNQLIHCVSGRIIPDDKFGIKDCLKKTEYLNDKKLNRLLENSYGPVIKTNELLLQLHAINSNKRTRNLLSDYSRVVKTNDYKVKEYSELTVKELIKQPELLFLIKDYPIRVLTTLTRWVYDSKKVLVYYKNNNLPFSLELIEAEKKLLQKRKDELGFSLKDELVCHLLYWRLVFSDYKETFNNELLFDHVLPLLNQEEFNELVTLMDTDRIINYTKDKQTVIINSLSAMKNSPLESWLIIDNAYYFYVAYSFIIRMNPGTKRVIINDSITKDFFCKKSSLSGFIISSAKRTILMGNDELLTVTQEEVVNELKNTVCFIDAFWLNFTEEEQELFKKLKEWIVINDYQFSQAHKNTLVWAK